MKYPRTSWAWKRPWMMIPVFFLSLHQPILAQITNISGRCHAVGGCISTMPGTGQPGLNPASLSGMENMTFSLGHSLPFLVKEIGISSLDVFVPVHRGVFRFSSTGYGLPGFRYFSHTVSFGMQLHPKLFAGALIQMSHIAASEDWRYQWHMGPGLGCIFLPDGETAITICITNPISAGNLPVDRYLTPGLISLGAWRTIYANTRFMMEVLYHTRQSLQWKTGLEYALLPSIRFGLGFHTSPTTLSAGFGYKSASLGIDGFIAWSGLQGITPGLTLSYHFNR